MKKEFNLLSNYIIIRFILILLFLLCRCGLRKYEFWEGLTPSNNEIAKSVEEAKLYFSEKANRIEAVNSALTYVDSFYISRINQIRLSLFVGILGFCSEESEYDSIVNILLKGRKHRDFIGNFIVGSCSVAPPFILFTIDTISKNRNYFAHLPNPDSGLIEKVYLEKYIIYDLETATGEKFGNDFEKWKIWWKTEGQYLKYDWKLMKYIRNVGEGNEDLSRNKKINKENEIIESDLFMKLGYLDNLKMSEDGKHQ